MNALADFSCECAPLDSLSEATMKETFAFVEASDSKLSLCLLSAKKSRFMRFLSFFLLTSKPVVLSRWSKKCCLPNLVLSTFWICYIRLDADPEEKEVHLYTEAAIARLKNLTPNTPESKEDLHKGAFLLFSMTWSKNTVRRRLAFLNS